jgi:hypothetical protein
VAIVNYGDLLLSGSGNKTFAGVTTIAGDLVISDGQLLLFNNTGSSTGTLTLGKSSNNFGSYGGVQPLQLQMELGLQLELLMYLVHA